jgi:DMSO/TMAO reductase YedYZ molybdopterin-dependent catalytic subunit
MTDPIGRISTPGRVADPAEGLSTDELRLAARNHGLPLEAMRDDVTPPGLHYVLSHYDMPALDATTWKLTIGGAVGRPIELGLDDLRSRPARTVRVTLECAGNGRAALHPRPVSQPWLEGAVGTADWTGVPLRELLREADPTDEAVEVVFTGADHGIERGVEQDYQRALALDEALGDDVLLAYEMNGAPLPRQHGFPLRLVVPGWYGMAHVKWVRDIAVVDRPFEGFQHQAYRLRQTVEEPGEAVTRIEPRALLVPPGIPDFMSRVRFVRPGAVTLEGRAWSGWAPVERVEVSTDDGRGWVDAELADDGGGPWAWRRFAVGWEAGPGEYVLRARAHDASGRSQPDAPRWSRGGFANNADQGLRVVVLDP